MTNRRWGVIDSGATFECLATTLVFFEDSKAALFGRRGRDGGQDARSGDGTRVFQVKHHVKPTAAKAIADAKSEVAKVAQYREASHPRFAQWEHVRQWRLITNATFNPTDQKGWDDEVIPLFAALGLTADYWELAQLDGLLDKHPEVSRSFFENETRVFLSVPEISERLPSQEPFLRRADLGPFCGRAIEKSAIRDFLASDRLFLVVHGQGGTGKTRLLVDAAEEIAGDGDYQVLWANVESMVATGSWFDAVVPERRTLLLVDEPQEVRVLQQLAEQLGGRVGRTAKWKVVVAVRSPKDPVLRFLRLARMKRRVQELALDPLPSLDAEEMCFELLRTGRRADLPDASKREAARQLSQRFARYPVWLTLAIQHLEDHDDLKRVPADAEALADEYIREVEKGQSDVAPESVGRMLRWVALIGTVNRQDDGVVMYIGEQCGLPSSVDVRERFAALIRRRALTERGAHKRFVEVKPDVLRDHILLRWLARDTGGAHPEVSAEGMQVLEPIRAAAVHGSLSRLQHSILSSLARTEFILRLSGHEFGLLRGFLAALEAALPTMSAGQRVGLVDVLDATAYFHPCEAASLVQTLRENIATAETVEGIFGSKVVDQRDVVLSLAWPFFGAAMGAQSPGDQEIVLRELCALARAEAELAPSLSHGLPNDGQRAAALVTRVLEGGPQFWSEYDQTAQHLSVELLGEIAREVPSRGQIALLDALVQPLLETERRQTWADDHSFTWRTFSIEPGSVAWSARGAVLALLMQTLSSEAIPSASRLQLWRVFARVRDGNALERLNWTYGVLTSRPSSIEELAAAREVWDWHRRYDKNAANHAIAVKLEALYEDNELAKEFHPLLPSFEDWQNQDARASRKGEELASASSPAEIVAFLDRAVAFFGSDGPLVRLGTVAWSLGEHAETSEVVRDFIREALATPRVDPRAEFVAAAAVPWLTATRTSTPALAHTLVSELLGRCGSTERQAHLLERIYSRVPKLAIVGEFTPEERTLLRSSRELFTSTGREAAFIAALALSVNLDWPTTRPLLEEVLHALPKERISRAMHALVDALYWAVREEGDRQVPAGLGEWVMTELLALTDLDDIGGDAEWHLAELLRKVGRPAIRWLPGALRLRQVQEASSGSGSKPRAVSRNARVSKYVQPIDASHALDIDVVAAVDTMLAFITDNGSVGYYLPEVLRDVDPQGLVVPFAAATRAVRTADAEEVRRLARIGGAYAVNTAPWRTVALAVIRAANTMGSNALQAVYSSLGERGFRSWSGTVGEVPAIFITAIREARAALDAESDELLLPYWQVRLAAAETELGEEEERAREERGE